MKDPWYMGIPTYCSALVNGRNSSRLLLALLTFSIVSSLANRWLYEDFPTMSLAIKIPVEFNHWDALGQDEKDELIAPEQERLASTHRVGVNSDNIE